MRFRVLVGEELCGKEVLQKLRTGLVGGSLGEFLLIISVLVTANLPLGRYIFMYCSAEILPA